MWPWSHYMCIRFLLFPALLINSTHLFLYITLPETINNLPDGSGDFYDDSKQSRGHGSEKTFVCRKIYFIFTLRKWQKYTTNKSGKVSCGMLDSKSLCSSWSPCLVTSVVADLYDWWPWREYAASETGDVVVLWCENHQHCVLHQVREYQWGRQNKQHRHDTTSTCTCASTHPASWERVLIRTGCHWSSCRQSLAGPENIPEVVDWSAGA